MADPIMAHRAAARREAETRTDALARECKRLSRERSRQDRDIEITAHVTAERVTWTAIAPCRPARQRDRYVIGRGHTVVDALTALADALRAKPIPEGGRK